MSKEKSNSSTKRLVKILVIVGIGIPVLIELMTLFNLVNVQIFKDENASNEVNGNVSQVREISEGDSLFTEHSAAIIIDQLRIKVSAREWRFEIGLQAVDSLSQDELQIDVDSLKLQSNKTLMSKDSRSKEIRNDRPVLLYSEWDLPNGDIPKRLYVSSMQQVTEGSTDRIQQEIPLEKIPVRYNQE